MRFIKTTTSGYQLAFRTCCHSVLFIGLAAMHSLIDNNAQAATNPSEATLKGSFTQGGMLIGQTATNNSVKLNGKKIRVTPNGQFILGFGRDAKTRHKLTITSPQGGTQTQTITLKKRQYNTQKITGVPQRTVSPSKKSLERIRAETRKIVAARATNSDLENFLETFQWPLIGRITGVYGSQRFYNGVPKRPHFGIDIAAPKGTPVVAPAAGKVTLTHPDMFFSGGTLIMDHGYGMSSTFIHLDKILVKEGQSVKQGDVIAKVGSTGRSTGPHLDWRINWYKVRMDPALIVPKMPDQKK